MKRRTYIYTPEKRDDFGEGVEKKEDNFADEVSSMIK